MITLRPALLRQHWRAVLKGAAGAVFSQSDIDSDGRTRSKSIRTLVDEGVIEAVDPLHRVALRLRDDTHFYRFTAKCIAALEPGRKPDLALITGVASLPDYRLTQQPGVAVEERGAGGLSLPEYRYVAEHRDEYTFTDSWGKVVDPTDRGAQWDMLICDDALTAAIAARKLVIDTERATKKNLVWGLNRVGAMPEVQTRELAVFRPRSDDLLGASEIRIRRRSGAVGEGRRRRHPPAARAYRAGHPRPEHRHPRQRVHPRPGGWGAFVDEYTIAIAERIAEKTTPAPAPTGADAPDAAGNPAAGTLAEVFARDDARLLREKAGG